MNRWQDTIRSVAPLPDYMVIDGTRVMSDGRDHIINGYHASGDTVPFGGMKQSGIGREKGLAALANYCEVKSVTVSI